MAPHSETWPRGSGSYCGCVRVRAPGDSLRSALTWLTHLGPGGMPPPGIEAQRKLLKRRIAPPGAAADSSPSEFVKQVGLHALLPRRKRLTSPSSTLRRTRTSSPRNASKCASRCSKRKTTSSVRSENGLNRKRCAFVRPCFAHGRSTAIECRHAICAR